VVHFIVCSIVFNQRLSGHACGSDSLSLSIHHSTGALCARHSCYALLFPQASIDEVSAQAALHANVLHKKVVEAGDAAAALSKAATNESDARRDACALVSVVECLQLQLQRSELERTKLNVRLDCPAFSAGFVPDPHEADVAETCFPVSSVVSARTGCVPPIAILQTGESLGSTGPEQSSLCLSPHSLISIPAVSNACYPGTVITMEGDLGHNSAHGDGLDVTDATLFSASGIPGTDRQVAGTKRRFVDVGSRPAITDSASPFVASEDCLQVHALNAITSSTASAATNLQQL
jgi:hypothetical protein